MTENEVWKDVVGYEGQYQVSDIGNVRSVARKDSIGRKCGGVTLRPSHDKYGYLRVTLCKNSKLNTKLVHRLVAQAFVPNPNGYSEINHRDENKVNNELSNLEWCDAKHNVNYGTRNTRVSQKLSKKVRAVNVETGEIVTFSSVKKAEKKGYYNISQACRGTYKSGKTGKLIGDGHTYRGHRWSYE